jgi:hypothetical protein
VTPTLDPEVLEFLTRDTRAPSTTVGVILLGVLLAALTAKVLLESASPSPRRDRMRLLNVVIAPLVLVFVAIVIERFRVLT